VADIAMRTVEGIIVPEKAGIKRKSPDDLKNMIIPGKISSKWIVIIWSSPEFY